MLISFSVYALCWPFIALCPAVSVVTADQQVVLADSSLVALGDVEQWRLLAPDSSVKGKHTANSMGTRDFLR